ncbi:MAG TPA: right-handed parallel beta-helix repeat-containing protein [Verrucomicrobiae bacterium]
MKTSQYMQPYLLKILPALTAGGVLFTQTSPAKTVTITASNADQTAYFQAQVNTLVDGDTLVLTAGNHYLSGFINVYFNNGFINGNGSVIRKIAGSTSGLTLYGNGDHLDQIEIDGGGAGTHGPCLVVLNGTGTFITNSKFHHSGDDTGLLLDHTSHVTVQGCACYYNYMCGISQSACTDQSILDNQLYGNGAEGLTIDTGSHNCTVYNCWVHQNNTPGRGVGGIGIDGSNGANISACTIDQNGNNGITFQNNLNQPDDGCVIHDNPNISNNGRAAVGINKSHLVTHLGFYNNTCTGNPGGNGVVIFSP